MRQPKESEEIGKGWSEEDGWATDETDVQLQSSAPIELATTTRGRVRL